MTFRVLLVLLGVCVSVAVAMPHVLSLPLEDLEVLEEVLPILRMARSRNMLIDEVIVTSAADAEERSYSPYDSKGAASSHHDLHGDHVDYGAYTGKHGAFGWYTDHPVLVRKGGYH